MSETKLLVEPETQFATAHRKEIADFMVDWARFQRRRNEANNAGNGMIVMAAEDAARIMLSDNATIATQAAQIEWLRKAIENHLNPLFDRQKAHTGLLDALSTIPEAQK